MTSTRTAARWERLTGAIVDAGLTITPHNCTYRYPGANDHCLTVARPGGGVVHIQDQFERSGRGPWRGWDASQEDACGKRHALRTHLTRRDLLVQAVQELL